MVSPHLSHLGGAGSVCYQTKRKDSLLVKMNGSGSIKSQILFSPIRKQMFKIVFIMLILISPSFRELKTLCVGDDDDDVCVWGGHMSHGTYVEVTGQLCGVGIKLRSAS